MPTTLIRLESPDPRPDIGGCLFTFSPTFSKVISWQSARPIHPTLDAAKHYTAELMDTLTRIDSEDSRSAIRETNWVSVVAALQVIIREWNERLVGVGCGSGGPAIAAPGSRMVS